jgi:two-component system sensor histidine kinase PhoQ
LLVSERNRHKQYRHLLDDLAHSLKTPLSVLRNIADAKALAGSNNSPGTITAPDTDASVGSKSPAHDINEDTIAVIGTQTTQMQNTLERYLQRATMRTPQTLAPPLSALPVIQRLAATLEKVFARGSHARVAENNATVAADNTSDFVHFDISVSPDFHVRLSDVDLYEILGNVLENACKYGASSIRISAEQDQRKLIIDDNGPGFPEGLLHSLTQRGVRADTTVAGQGLGLAASRELLQSYGGELVLGSSPEHGARVLLRFP